MKPRNDPEIPLSADESIDEFVHGRLRLIQSRCGYRFSIDAVLLSEFVTIREGDRVVDLGTGCGIIPLLLLVNRPVSSVTGIEIQPEMARQAGRNIFLNRFFGKMTILLADIRAMPLRPSFADVVVCNPPYRPVASGRINPNPQRAIARHEIHMVLDDILEGSRRILKPGGRLALIYPTTRTVDVLAGMRRFGLEPKRLRFIHPDVGAEAKMVLVEACAGGRRGIKVLPPLLTPREISMSS